MIETWLGGLGPVVAAVILLVGLRWQMRTARLREERERGARLQRMAHMDARLDEIDRALGKLPELALAQGRIEAKLDHLDGCIHRLDDRLDRLG